jgi:hypothetical protein
VLFDLAHRFKMIALKFPARGLRLLPELFTSCRCFLRSQNYSLAFGQNPQDAGAREYKANMGEVRLAVQKSKVKVQR